MQNKTIRASLLGDQIAENDVQNLNINFIETSAYRTIIESKDATVIIGRRGTGKSAIFYKLNEVWRQQKNYSIPISPEDQETIFFRKIFSFFNTNYSTARAAARIFLKYGFYLEILNAFQKDYKLKDICHNEILIFKELNDWNKYHPNSFFMRLALKIKEAIKAYDDPELALGFLSSDLNIPEIEKFIEKNINNKKNNICILLDKLDEGYENDEIGAAIVSGTILSGVEINKKFDKVRIVIFQRDNIIRSVARYDHDYTRNIEGELIRIHWEFRQLFTLITKRINSSLDLKIENSRKIWDRVTADQGNGNELKGEEGFRKCLQFTLYRPRDIISLLNKAFYQCLSDDRNTLIMSDIEAAAKLISKARLDDLQKEYEAIFPSIRPAVNAFMGTTSKMSVYKIRSQLETYFIESITLSEKEKIDYTVLSSDGVLRALYSVGFVGIYDKQSSIFTFCHDGRNPDREFRDNDNVLIHPCYWIALNLSKNALSPDDAEQINDEYEIQVTSLAPQLRSQRIGELTSQLGNIPDGVASASEFEQWCFNVIKLIFTSHLDNFTLHPNGVATQRRDIVATNIEGSSVWRRIRADYKVRQVIFEVKNYKDIGSDEYRQLGSYLAKNYGNLGFIITKSDSNEPRKGAELDWCLEMYNMHKKLIIKLNAKFLASILSKLRSPEKYDVVDKNISKLLDIYERNYLSQKSSRK
ncbi:P-loop ATPase, Sll1717 family [Acinetobacter radioresistens]|uniref:P-loop ATPase, Sll1717 family n=1 Tax=Acinetobacter radioresistens TaxID=40216 RepID=UPI002246869A|nr:hypothetical protein [Acinetobacter radioresistens]MCX0338459.1 hypothetical protein [Acinetobacter radioresistens]